MAQEAASGRAIRDSEDDVNTATSTTRQGGQDWGQQNSFAEAGRVSRQFGHVLHRRLDAYTGSIDEFGCPGNTVDSWRLLFNSRDSGLKAANSGAKRRR